MRSKTARRRLRNERKKVQDKKNRAATRKILSCEYRVVKILRIKECAQPNSGPCRWRSSNHNQTVLIAVEPFTWAFINNSIELDLIAYEDYYPGEGIACSLADKINYSASKGKPLVFERLILLSAEVTDIGEVWARVITAPENLKVTF